MVTDNMVRMAISTITNTTNDTAFHSAFVITATEEDLGSHTAISTITDMATNRVIDMAFYSTLLLLSKHNYWYNY